MSPARVTVLVVDDDVDACANLADLLADLGDYRIDVAHDGLSALELARQNRYDIALLDLKMPGMDGLTLYRELKRLHPGTVAVLISCHAGASIIEEAAHIGLWRIVEKPVDFAGLAALVVEAMALPKVLLVDDDRNLCEALWDLLNGNGYRVCVAHDIGQAERRLESCSYRIILSDMKLPDGDGLDLLRRVRLSFPQMRRILITGYPEELAKREPDADAVCLKPFHVPIFLATIGRLSGQG